ncbi:hypothetical protein M758_9G018300 [Ceratodon purpureus]|nr:hypothetical protein M758_9G018300 [Ceratodon purpureus]
MLVPLVAFSATLFSALDSTGIFKYQDHPAFVWCAVALTGVVALITLCFSFMTFLTAPGSKLRHILHSATVMLAAHESDRVLAFYRRNGLTYGHYSNPITNRLEREVVSEFMSLVERKGLKDVPFEDQERPHEDVNPHRQLYSFQYENFTWVNALIDPVHKEAQFTVSQRGKKQCYLTRPFEQYRFGHLLGVLRWLQSNQKQGIWETVKFVGSKRIARCLSFESIFVAAMDGDGFDLVPLKVPQTMILA